MVSVFLICQAQSAEGVVLRLMGWGRDKECLIAVHHQVSSLSAIFTTRTMHNVLA